MTEDESLKDEMNAHLRADLERARERGPRHLAVDAVDVAPAEEPPPREAPGLAQRLRKLFG